MSPLVHIGIVTVSDRASRGVYEDRGGPAIHAWLSQALATPWEAVRRIIPDERPLVEATLRALCADQGCCLVVTTGGTGPAPRDITPDATAAVCDRLLDGFAEQMRAVSLRQVPTAILSRQTAGVCGQALVINLPGNPAAIAECLAAVFPAIPYCLELLDGPSLATHSDVVQAYRPPHAARREPSGHTLRTS